MKWETGLDNKQTVAVHTWTIQFGGLVQWEITAIFTGRRKHVNSPLDKDYFYMFDV